MLSITILVPHWIPTIIGVLLMLNYHLRYKAYPVGVDLGATFGFETGFMPSGNHFMKVWEAKDNKSTKMYTESAYD